MPNRLFRSALFLIAAFMVGGCLESDQMYYINPDGSGKVVVTSITKPFDMGEQKASKDEIKKFVTEVIEGSSGVELWKDVSCKKLGDGRIQFKGTAYFRDAGALELKSVAMNPVRVERDGSSMRIMYGKEEPETEAGPPVTLTEDEIQQKADSLKQNMTMAMGMMSMIFDGMREHATIKFAGTASEVRGFQRKADGTVDIELNGKRVLHVLDSVMAQPGFWREQVIADAGGGKPDRDKEMRRTMFGTDDPLVQLNTANATPLFNYAAEVAAAKKGYAALLKKYKIKPQ